MPILTVGTRTFKVTIVNGQISISQKDMLCIIEMITNEQHGLRVQDANDAKRKACEELAQFAIDDARKACAERDTMRIELVRLAQETQIAIDDGRKARAERDTALSELDTMRTELESLAQIAQIAIDDRRKARDALHAKC